MTGALTSVSGWICPRCHRRFGRLRQSHECAPAMSLEEYFACGPSFERPIFEAVMALLSDVGPVHVEPVSVGIFLKTTRGFAELRPMRKWVALSFFLSHRVAHRTITRAVREYHGRYFHVANLRGPEDLDDDLGGWLIEAYLDSP